MARAAKPSRRDERVSDETSETAPKSTELSKPKERRKKGAGRRFSPMNAAYGDSAVPDFPRIDGT